MSGFFVGEGNIGETPTLRYHAVDGEQRAVLNMSVYFDHRVPDEDGVYKDEGGFWMPVSYWGKRAEHAARLLKKGARVSVQGEQYRDTWTDKDTGEEKFRTKIKASFVGIDPLCVESITFKRRSESEEQSSAPSSPTAEEVPYDDDMPH